MPGVATVATALALTLAAPASAPVEPASAPDGAPFWGCSSNPWSCCLAGHAPCVRPKPARLLLSALGMVSAAAGAAMLLVAGERLGSRDPAGLMVGAGGISVAGAIFGAFAGLTMGDAPGSPDRIRPPTLGADMGFGRPAVLDENHPPSLALRWAPTFTFPHNQGRIRFFGNFGGLLGEEVDVDPRPQNQTDAGTFPPGRVERRFTGALGLDMAVYLPYPVLDPARSKFLGAAEIRYKPEVQFRRHVFHPGSAEEHVVSRTMVLPLTVGMRWNVAPRQRFTFYIGPRWDFISGTTEDSLGVARGKAVVGPIYGEAWYDVDVPITMMSKVARRRRVEVNGLLTFGYVHSRFDGLGFNISGAIGFAGPIQMAWTMRFRPVGARWAAQLGVGTWIGNGVSPFATLGVALPDLGRKTPPGEKG